MQTIRGIFTIRQNNPVSIGIRCMIPRSLTTMAQASHVIGVDGDHAIEANMLHGVRRVPLKEALKGAKIVREVDFVVPDREAGLRWGRGSVGSKYDFSGAVGLGLAPDREWQDPADWFCFEHFAMMLAKAGRDIFAKHAHVTADKLLSIIP